MHSVLTEMGEELASTAYVEYWSRDEYMHIDAHADIDEVEFEMLDSDTSALRCPMMGHVLYLDVLREELYGPTCVFPGTNIGWDYKYKYNNNNNYDEQTRARTSYNGTKEQGVELVTVPAVQGRVLRFPGSAMHAVPKPAHRWLLSDEENDRLTKLDEDDDDDDEESRAVLLFNTWREPPQGVSGDYATGVMPDGIELDEEDMQEHIASLEEEFYSEWEEEYGVDAERVLCKPQCEWKEVEIQEHDHSNCNGSSETEGEAQVVRIGLMGKKERRVYAGSNVRLRGPFESVRSALEEKSIPTRFHLSEEEQESKET